MTGPPSMPFPWFADDNNLFRLQRFCELSANRRLYFHPHHNWFISNSMQVADLEEAVELAGEAMNALKNES